MWCVCVYGTHSPVIALFWCLIKFTTTTTTTCGHVLGAEVGHVLGAESVMC